MEALAELLYEEFGLVGVAGFLLYLLLGVGTLRLFGRQMEQQTRPGSEARQRGLVWQIRASILFLLVPLLAALAWGKGWSPEVAWLGFLLGLYSGVAPRLWVRFVQPGTPRPRPTALFFCLGSQAYWLLGLTSFTLVRHGWSSFWGVAGMATILLGFLACVAFAFTRTEEYRHLTTPSASEETEGTRGGTGPSGPIRQH